MFSSQICPREEKPKDGEMTTQVADDSNVEPGLELGFLCQNQDGPLGLIIVPYQSYHASVKKSISGPICGSTKGS